ncbi:hypothetical protein HYU13_00180 [Candidatus Woesearchaeota archaeon]|nr:hypothetical protein [Candidatus Woesearchaeota archaeon]
MRTDVRSLTNHLGRLRGILPSVRVQEPKKEKPKSIELPKIIEAPKPAKQVRAAVPEKPKHLNEAERIESELAQIEAELDKMTA